MDGLDGLDFLSFFLSVSEANEWVGIYFTRLAACSAGWYFYFLLLNVELCNGGQSAVIRDIMLQKELKLSL